MRTKKALVAFVTRTAEGDASTSLIAKTLDGVLLHNNFMSETARGQAQSNVTFATLLHEQKNLIKALADFVARLGRDYRSLNDKVDQGHNLLDGKITDVHNQVGNINDNINSMKSDNATANATADANAAATKLQMDKMMDFMMRDTTSAAAAPAVPVSTPAQLQPQAKCHIRSNLNPTASPFSAPISSASLPASLPASFPAPSMVPAPAPTSVIKDTFKPTRCDKVAGEDVYTFAENFYKVTKGKYNKIINNTLISLCSGDHDLGKFLAAHPSSGPTAQLNGMSEEWMQFPLLCNMRSQFLTSTSHILAVRDAIVT
jgi:hypothetical protein